MSEAEHCRLNIKALPANLNEAINLLEQNSLMRKTLGEHIFQHYINAKREE